MEKKLKELKAQALALMPQFLHQVFEFLAKKDNATADAASTSVENLQLQSLELRALDEVTQSALEDKVAAFLRSKQGDAFAYLRKAFSVYASRSEKITAGVIGGVLLLGALAIVMMMGVVPALTIAMTPNLSSIIMGTLLPIIVSLGVSLSFHSANKQGPLMFKAATTCVSTLVNVLLSAFLANSGAIMNGLAATFGQPVIGLVLITLAVMLIDGIAATAMNVIANSQMKEVQNVLDAIGNADVSAQSVDVSALTIPSKTLKRSKITSS